MKLVINWLQHMNVEEALEQAWQPNNRFRTSEKKL
jgi:hypothetical protein